MLEMEGDGKKVPWPGQGHYSTMWESNQQAICGISTASQPRADHNHAAPSEASQGPISP